MRLLLNQQGVLRCLAFIEVGQDGSTNLGLPRDGVNTTTYRLTSKPGDQVQKIEFDSPRERTKRISLHISGRINYKWEAATSPVFIHCLLDLQQPAHVVTYIVPDVAQLDTVGGRRKDDYKIALPFAPQGHVAFTFDAIPWHFPEVNGEVVRAVVEEAYALRCIAMPGDLGTVAAGLPAAAFSLVTSTMDRLEGLALPEDEAYLRFQHHRHAIHIRAAADQGRQHMVITDEMVAKEIAKGPGLITPNAEGVWTVICRVPMSRKPVLQVIFKEPWHIAELVDLRPEDKRLEKVRARFRVQDTRTGSWVKHPVEIEAVILNAEL